MDYLLKASAVLIIFYVSYKLFLQRETFFQSNRWFLLSGLILALSIPLVVIPIYIEYTPVQTSAFTYTNTTNIPLATIEETPFNYLQLLIWSYGFGVLFFFGKLIIEFISLKKILSTSRLQSSGQVKVLETSEHVAPFSFFNRIVYNPSQFKANELAHVINHERVHTKELHSIDTIIAQLSCIVFWFNPIVWLYKKALQQNLEFIADQKAQHISECDKSYQTVLLKASVKNHQLAFTNNFYTSLIKKRIIMLHKSKSKKVNQLKFALVLPILALFMMSFNTKDIYVEIPIVESLEESPVFKQNDNIEIVITKDTSDEELKALQEKLKSKGITFSYSKVKRNSKGEITSIATDFKNDDHASNYNISGDDGIKPFRFKSQDDSFSIGTIDVNNNTFIYESKDGKTKSTGSNNVFVFRSDEDEDKKEKRSSKKIKIKGSNEIDTVYFKQSNGQYIWTSDDKTRTKIVASENGNNNVFVSREGGEPIFIVDGKVVSKATLEDVDSQDIESINVLKGKMATQAYGGKAKNGAVVMTTKNASNVQIIDSDGKTSSFAYTISDTDGEQPIYIIDGKVMTKGEMSDLNPNNIDNIEVIKDKKALKVYGAKGKNGAVIINTKTGTVFSGQNKPIIVEVEEDGPWKIETAVTSAYFVNDDGDIESIEFVISKNSSDAFLDEQKKNLKAQGIDAKFTKVRRNKAGEITSIKITLDDNDGRKSSSSWKEKDQAIPDIVMGKSNDDKLFIRAIGH